MLRYCIRIWRVYQATSTTYKAVVWLVSLGVVPVIAFLSNLLMAIASAVVLAAVLFGVGVFLSLPAKSGIHTPRYLIWYRLPLRRISFNFDNYLGLKAEAGVLQGVGGFQAEVRFNRGRNISVTNAFIGSVNTGEQIPIQFRTSSGYLTADKIEYIPAHEQCRIQSKFDSDCGYYPIEAFLQDFSGFELVLEWDGRRFSRTFARSEIEGVIESFRRYSNPEPPRQIVRRDQPD